MVLSRQCRKPAVSPMALLTLAMISQRARWSTLTSRESIRDPLPRIADNNKILVVVPIPTICSPFPTLETLLPLRAMVPRRQATGLALSRFIMIFTVIPLPRFSTQLPKIDSNNFLSEPWRYKRPHDLGRLFCIRPNLLATVSFQYPLTPSIINIGEQPLQC